MMLAKVNIATLNCKGILNNKKLILNLLKSMDICFLTETWVGEWDPDILCDIKMAGHRVYTTSIRRQTRKKGRQGCMTAFIVKENLKKMIKLEHINKRISVLKMNTLGESGNPLEMRGYALIGVYLSCNNNAKNEFELDLGILDVTYSRLLREGYKPIITGDLNADISRLKYTNDILMKSWENKKKYIELSRLYTQKVPNTFLSSRGQYSNIDHFLVTDEVPWPEIEQINIKVTDGEFNALKVTNWKESIKSCWDWNCNTGDHRAVTLSMNVQIRKSHWNEKKSSVKKRINWKNEKHKKIFAKLLQEGLNKVEEFHKTKMNEDDATICITKLELIMKEADAAAIKQIYGRSKKEQKYKKSKSWWNKELAQLVKGRNFASTRLYDLNRAGRRRGGTSNTKHMNKIRFYALARGALEKKFKKLSKKSKKIEKKREREKLVENFLKNPDIFWKQVTSKRGARVEVDISLETLREAYKKNFTTIDKSIESEQLEKKMFTIVEKYCKLIKSKKSKFRVDEKVIYEILHNLKNNKASGLNGIKNEMFKYGRDTTLTTIITRLFQNIIRGGFFPRNLNIGLICTIIKDATGSNQSLDNIRPITLSETLSIILENFILGHLLKGDTLHRQQFGFRKNSSCMHAVFTIKEIMADVKKRGDNAYAVYLDFSKAFDKVNRVKLLCLMLKSTDPNIWLLIKLYYENLLIHVVDKDGNISTSFEATVGVKQGGSMSPWLFNKYINNLIAKLEASGKTYQLNGQSKGILVYADDTNVIAHNPKDLYICIFIIERYCMLYDIAINEKKTKWMLFGEPKSNLNEEIRVNGTILEKVNSFKFLGVIIEDNGSHKEHISKRRSLFMTGLGEIQRLGFSRKDIPVKMKKILYTSLVRSKLIYGIETINMSKIELKRNLIKLESNCLKMACGVNLRSKSTSLIYGMGVTPIELYIYKRKLCFILQLLKNKATNDLVSRGTHETLKEIIKDLEVGVEDVRQGPEWYHQSLRVACFTRLKEITEKEKIIKSIPVVIAVEYLLAHRSMDNDDTLQYLLDPRRGTRG
jgi:hypothetical protein